MPTQPVRGNRGSNKKHVPTEETRGLVKGCVACGAWLEPVLKVEYSWDFNALDKIASRARTEGKGGLPIGREQTLRGGHHERNSHQNYPDSGNTRHATAVIDRRLWYRVS